MRARQSPVRTAAEVWAAVGYVGSRFIEYFGAIAQSEDTEAIESLRVSIDQLAGIGHRLSQCRERAAQCAEKHPSDLHTIQFNAP